MTESTLFSWIYGICILVLLFFIARELHYLYYNHPRSYGKNGVWPTSGSYVPDSEGSGGIDPATQRMRPAKKAPASVEVGWWGGAISQDVHAVSDHSLYDGHADIPAEVETTVGWWGDDWM